MRCLYEVLEVERDVDDATVKSAYRKAALRWHPDKNRENLEEANERFQEIQNAYQVLSDPHERAWYDSHREAILNSDQRHQAGAEGFTPGARPDSDFDLFPYFNASCFSGYGDGPKGFYAVYGDVFQRISQGEVAAYTGLGKRVPQAPPAFGTSTSPYEVVGSFYAFWTSFATAKDFCWADQYNPSSAPNRKVRRLMEAENAKKRKAAKKDFNETVRELASFVRKRDKRVAAQRVVEAEQRLEREQRELRRREQEKAERAARAQAYQDASWAQQQEADSAESEEDVHPDEADPLYCLACDKHFKSEGAFKNHERSKKHLEKITALRSLLTAEELSMMDEASAEEPRASQAPLTNAAEGHAIPDKHGRREKTYQRGARSTPCAEKGSGSGEAGKPACPSQPGQQELGMGAGNAISEETRGAAEDTGASGSSSTSGDDEAGDEEEETDKGVDGDDDEEAMLARMMQSHQHRGQPKKELPDDLQHKGSSPTDSTDSEGTSGVEDDGCGGEVDEGEDEEEAMLARMLRSQQGRRQQAKRAIAQVAGDLPVSTSARSQQPHAPETDSGGGAAGPATSSGGPAGAERAGDDEERVVNALLQHCLDRAEEAQGGERTVRSPSQTEDGDSATPPSRAEAVERQAQGKKGIRASKHVQSLPQVQAAQAGKGSRKQKSRVVRGDKDRSTVCTVCLLDCGSRNQLFKHIAATGHAALKG